MSIAILTVQGLRPPLDPVAGAAREPWKAVNTPQLLPAPIISMLQQFAGLAGEDFRIIFLYILTQILKIYGRGTGA